ncbi:MAG: hypothetical protein M3474_00820 [Actinomycetota bacterium]|nr:hypothetical protein [Actinomycetota bacterium]
MIVQEFATRGLQPLEQRECSARRGRRQVQFGAVGLIGIVVSQVAIYLAIGWASVRRYGDEERA